jgi:type IV secretory pathway VirB6-like protein
MFAFILNFIAAVANRNKREGEIMSQDDKNYFKVLLKLIVLVAGILLAAKVSLWLTLPIAVAYAVTLIRDE